MLFLFHFMSCTAQPYLDDFTVENSLDLLSQYHQTKEVKIQESDSIVITGSIFKGMLSPNKKNLVIVSNDGRCCVVDVSTGKVVWHFQSQQWMSDGLCEEMSRRANTVFKYYNGNDIHSNHKPSFIPNNVYELPVFRNQIRNALFVSDSILLFLGSFTGVGVDTVSHQSGYTVVNVGGIVELNLNSHKMGLAFFHYDNPPSPSISKHFVYDSINHQILIGCYNGNAEKNKVWDSAWTIARYSMDGQRIKYDILPLPVEHRNSSLGYNLIGGFSAIDKQQNIWVSFAFIDRLFNISTNSTFPLKIGNENNLSFDHLDKNTVIPSSELIEKFPISISRIDCINNHIFLVGAFESRNNSSMKNQIQWFFQKYNQKNQELELSVKIPYYINNREVRYIIPSERHIYTLLFDSQNGWAIVEYEKNK